MSTTGPSHVPVMLQEVLGLLRPTPGEVVLDCTVGAGGHAQSILPLLGTSGRYVGLDADPAALQETRIRLGALEGPRLDLVHGNFAQAGGALADLGLTGADGILADLGVSSGQLENPDRGFSFSRDGPLDMRMDPEGPTTAADLVNTLKERDLADLIYRYGEERWSRRIARSIVEIRRRAPIQSTEALARICADACPGGRGGRRLDPATRTFQALRIAVNDEMASLEALLAAIPSLARPGARVVIISFHSLEDRLVKQAFQGWRKASMAQILTKKPLRPAPDEVASNRRSRSARCRGLVWQPLLKNPAPMADIP